jgi:hypothetical protein
MRDPKDQLITTMRQYLLRCVPIIRAADTPFREGELLADAIEALFESAPCIVCGESGPFHASHCMVGPANPLHTLTTPWMPWTDGNAYRYENGFLRMAPLTPGGHIITDEVVDMATLPYDPPEDIVEALRRLVR